MLNTIFRKERPTVCYTINTEFVLLQQTLSKVGLLSRVVGNQIRKAMDYVTEIQAACQEELSMPVEEVTVNSG
jgi:hypothetical protein